MSKLELVIEGEAGQVSLKSFVGILNRAQYILAGLDSAISEKPHGALDWYVTDLGVGSAIAVIESRAKIPEADERLGTMVGANFVAGLNSIEREAELPPYFSDVDLGRVRAISSLLRQTGSESLTAAHLNGARETATVSEQAGVNVAKILEPRFSGLGSVAGKLEVISVHGPPRFNVYDALTKRAVRCRFAPERLDDVAAALGRRVVVTGVVHRNAKGDPVKVDRPELRILPDGADLPSVKDLIGLVPDITGGLSSEEHVRRLRDG